MSNVLEVNESEKTKKFDKKEVSALTTALSVLLGQQDMEDASAPAMSFEQLVKEGYDLLKNESKPSTALLIKRLGMEPPMAKKVLTQVNKKIKESKNEKTPNTTPVTLIKTLPKGKLLLVKSHLAHLIHLDEKQRTPYLTGLKLVDCIDADEIAKAVEEGADKTLVNQIVKLSKKKRPAVPNKAIVDTKKYQKHIIQWTNKIEDGGDVFNLLAEQGLSKTVLAHFKIIANAQ